MPQVHFTPNLAQHIDAPTKRVEGVTVSEALDAVFGENPRLRGYVLDEQGRLRKHVAVFVDGEMIRDRLDLTDPVREDSELFVMQALSGG
jgi:molybdopterin synthase sulfur carrier subunit